LIARTSNNNQANKLFQVMQKIERNLYIQGESHIHSISKAQCVFSFTNQCEAEYAYGALLSPTTDFLDHTLTTFKHWNPMDKFGYDVANQDVSLSIKNYHFTCGHNQ
jgi:hypothetical protein